MYIRRCLSSSLLFLLRQVVGCLYSLSLFYFFSGDGIGVCGTKHPLDRPRTLRPKYNVSCLGAGVCGRESASHLVLQKFNV